MPLQQPLFAFPMEIGAWRGQAGAPLDARVEAIAGADAYINRVYRTPVGSLAGLYIGYYGSQRQGDSIHSPMNCLPGSGWQPREIRRIDLVDPRSTDGGRTVTLNNVIVENGDDRQVVLYWYEGRGRTIASEYVSKAYLFLDALRTGRTDAALVRIVVPIEGVDPSMNRRAERSATEFAVALLPELTHFLPN